MVTFGAESKFNSCIYICIKQSKGLIATGYKCINNAYILYKKFKKHPVPHDTFMEELAKSLIDSSLQSHLNCLANSHPTCVNLAICLCVFIHVLNFTIQKKIIKT